MDSENPPLQFRDTKTHSAEQTLRLPEEIIEEILSRLPVKPLLKFRCVSKSWRSLIGSKRFIMTHLENSTKNASFAHHRIILNPTRSCRRLEQCSLHSLLTETVTDSFAFDGMINIPRVSINLVGCCNGLVCILLDIKDFILWNPSTRMSKKLPAIDGKLEHGHITKYGFGYDESSDDYKVFGILSVFCITGVYEHICKVYSLKTNSWKVMKDRRVSPFDEAGKFASGKLNWKRGYGCRWDIVSFDLKSEVYGMVEQPSYSKGASYRTLGLLGGCLSVLCGYQKTHLDVWVMKQYGVKESWYKVVTVPHLLDLQKIPFLTPFAMGPNGEILLIFGSTFVICHPKDNVIQHPRKINHNSFSEAGLCIESLVSLVPDGEQGRQHPEPVTDCF